MSYFKLLFKKSIKNNYFLVPLVMSIVIIIGLFISNLNNQDKSLYIQELENKIINIDKSIDKSKKENLYIDNLIEQKDSYNEIIKMMESGEYRESYTMYIEQLDNEIKMLELLGSSGHDQSNSIKEIRSRIEEMEILSKDNILIDSSDSPTQGFNFLLFILSDFVPLMMIILLSYFLSQVFNDQYINGINKNDLIPSSHFNLLINQILVGILFSIITLSIIVIVSLIAPAIISRLGTASYPVLIYDAITKTKITTTISKIILSSIALQALSLIFIVVFIYVLSIFLKNKSSTFYISIIAILSGVYGIQFTPFLFKFMAYNPFIYINSVSVIDGSLSSKFNTLILLEKGVEVLIICIVVLVFITIINILVSRIVTKT